MILLHVRTTCIAMLTMFTFLNCCCYLLNCCNSVSLSLWIYYCNATHSRPSYRIDGVTVSMLTSSAVHHGFETGQTKHYTIGIYGFSAKHPAYQNNMSEWSNMSTRELLFQWASTIKIQLGVLVSPWYSWKIPELALNNNHTLTLVPFIFLIFFISFRICLEHLPLEVEQSIKLIENSFPYIV